MLIQPSELFLEIVDPDRNSSQPDVSCGTTDALSGILPLEQVEVRAGAQVVDNAGEPSEDLKAQSVPAGSHTH